MNNEQKYIFDVIINDVESNSGGFYFVYGGGGTGKTFLWNTILCKLRSEGKIVIAVASSGIAALLFPGGRTAHSRFKIPIGSDEFSCCSITKKSNLAELIQMASLIIWDEAPMTHKNDFEAVERTLQDIMNNIEQPTTNKIFGGKTLVLGGDFRQILPVITKGSRESIVGASINRSYIWNHCQVLRLTTNMRLKHINTTYVTNSVSDFHTWITDIGEGNVRGVSFRDGEEPNWIKIPDDLLIKAGHDGVYKIVSHIYDDLNNKFIEREYFKDRCILAPTNDDVDEINDYMLSTFTGNVKSYFSADSISPMSESITQQDMNFPLEFLNNIKVSGLPQHALHLKIGAPIMLIRNINQSRGLCNGTRLIITRLENKLIEAEIITGNNIGNKEIIPRIVMTSNNSLKWPFILKRVQYPIRLCFAMTINKSQGQTLKHVGVYLPKPVFTHGQLYVALSRTTTREGLKILIKNSENELEGYTQNIVYKEIFNNLQ